MTINVFAASCEELTAMLNENVTITAAGTQVTGQRPLTGADIERDMLCRYTIEGVAKWYLALEPKVLVEGDKLGITVVPKVIREGSVSGMLRDITLLREIPNAVLHRYADLRNDLVLWHTGEIQTIDEIDMGDVEREIVTRN